MSQEAEQEQSDRKKYEFRKVIEDLKDFAYSVRRAPAIPPPRGVAARRP